MKLDKNNYFSKEADKEYFSVSQFKSFRECEAKTVAKLNGSWINEKNEAFLLGSYVHSWNDGTIEEFRQQNPQLFKKDGSLLAKYEVADKMIKTLAKDPLIQRVREGEKEVIMTAELFNTKWKIMIDIYNPQNSVFVDLKTTREIHKQYWNDKSKTHQNFIEYYDYLLQMAVYAEVERINRGALDYLQPHIIAVSKEPIPDKAIIFLGTEFIKDKLLEVEVTIDRFSKVKQGLEEPIRCGKCDYCRTTEKLNSIINYTDL